MAAAHCLFLLLVCLPVCVGEKGQTLFSYSGQNDITFNESLLANLDVKSDIECARRCSITKDCETFTFTKGSPSGTCRLHSGVMTSHCPRNESVLGSTLYRVKRETGVDQCAAENSVCDQTCTSTGGSFTCGCNPGYELDRCNGRTCDDIDECAAGTSGCEQTCNNTVGSFTCGCNVGFRLTADNKTCEDVDECSNGTSGCDQTCNNTVGSFTCGCNIGFRLSADNKTCEDIDECAAGTCEQTCNNTVGSFTCGCNVGFRLTADNKTCEDVDECSNGTSGCDQTCNNTVGSFTCGCNIGFRLSADNKTCEDIDECAADTSGCEQTCNNTVGSFTCGCNIGFRLTADNKTCEDVDECSNGTSGCDQTCNNTVGSFTCGCNIGFRLSADNKTCEGQCSGPADNETWTVFQRRQDGSVDFYRPWADYVDGFGPQDGEFWLGLETLHNMTSEGTWALRIDLGDWEGNKSCASYIGFYITSSADGYRLTYDEGSYSGDAGDGFACTDDQHRGKQFSTSDHGTRSNCSDIYHGAWWYCDTYCFSSHLNGDYKPNSATAEWQGIMWTPLTEGNYSLKFTEMKMKRL